MRRASTALGVIGSLLALTLPACTRDSAPEQPDPNDRTLQKLKEEVDRANRGEAIGHAPDSKEDPNAKLAALAANDATPTHLKLPEGNQTVHVGTLALKLAEVTAAHQVQAGRVALTTEEAFLGVKLLAQNVGEKPAPVDLGKAQVRDGAGHLYSVASDAQRGGGTKDLSRSWVPDARDEVLLYFEVPPAVVGHGLSLVIPASAGGDKDVTLPLD